MNASKIVTLAAFGFLAPVALADDGSSGMPNFLMHWDASGDAQTNFEYNPNNFATIATTFDTWQIGGGPNGQGGPLRERTGWRYRGGLSSVNQWSLTWDCVANADPFVDATINVTNNSGAEQTFVVFMPLGIIPQQPLTIMTSSVSAVVTDADFVGGALLRWGDDPGNGLGDDPVFRGYIDGTQQSSLWNPGFTLNAPEFGSNNDTASANNVPGPGANAQIAVRLAFRLSAGDSASVTGIFEIHSVPGPAGLPLFAIFGALAARRRRRA